MKVLSFDLNGDYAHFRKYYTTSSPLTFSIVPPTAVYGIISAILGLSKENNFYLTKINSSSVYLAVRLLNPIKKTRIGINHINTKGDVWVPKQRKEGARTQIRTEFLKDVSYRLYVHLKEPELFSKLYNLVSQHKCIYTVSLGLSELLAEVKFRGYDDYYRKDSNETCEISTIIPISLVDKKNICFETGKMYMKERLPMDMDANRVVKSYDEVIFEANAQSIKVQLKEYWENSTGDKIVFLQNVSDD